MIEKLHYAMSDLFLLLLELNLEMGKLGLKEKELVLSIQPYFISTILELPLFPILVMKILRCSFIFQ